MNYSKTSENGLMVLNLSGDIIGEEDNKPLYDEVDAFLEKGGNDLIIDISDVRYINSSGIGVLITLLTKLRNKDGEVCLVNPSESVEKLLIITKLQAIFKVADTIEEAQIVLHNN